MLIQRIFSPQLVDCSNIAIIVVSCALAHYFPYHMVFYSYAILGTAHYFTQISWMHDRQYFCDSRRYALIMAGISVLASVFMFWKIDYNDLFYQYTFGLAIIFSALLSFSFKNAWQKGLFLGLSMLSLLVLVTKSTFMAIFVVVFATFLHTLVFTIAFMLYGAIKTKRSSAYWSVIVLIVGELTFLIPDTVNTLKPDLYGLRFFDVVMDAYQKIYAFSDQYEPNFFGLLSFTYTYHYLNWFSKAEVIRWHVVPRKRMLMMIMGFLFCVAAFFIHYALGIVFIFTIALAHGFLELSLNLKTMHRLCKHFFR